VLDSTKDTGSNTRSGSRYKWVALSNTTLGVLIANINTSIVLIALPDIFKGIRIDPLQPANTGYLLWLIMGFLVVTSVLVVSFGRLGDMFGRVRMYNAGFLIFTVSSVILAVTWFDGSAAALWLICWRIVQGIGGAFLMANSTAIVTDTFPARQRGFALSINLAAALAGQFLGLALGGVLAPLDWKLVFLVSVPFGLVGTVWGYLRLRDTGKRARARIDWWGNVTFAVGLVALLVGITQGIQPYGANQTGWSNPVVLACLVGGVVVLGVFAVIEKRTADPLFRLPLFRIRAFTLGNIANLCASLGRGGLQFILIIWLQGIWLPQHGYSFAQTPLWAGIYLLPLTAGYLAAALVSGALSDRIGARLLSTSGLVLMAVTFIAFVLLPVNFAYWSFAVVLVLQGVGIGMFSSPNRAMVMNSLPADERGAGSGMMNTFQNGSLVLSIGIFFSLVVVGLSSSLPTAMSQGLQAHGVAAGAAAQVAHVPAVAILFAAFLGDNPIRQLLGSQAGSLPPGQAAYLSGRDFFPQLISAPFHSGLIVAFVFAGMLCLVGAVASLFASGGRRKDRS
jgi:MFS family permease